METIASLDVTLLPESMLWRELIAFPLTFLKLAASGYLRLKRTNESRTE